MRAPDRHQLIGITLAAATLAFLALVFGGALHSLFTPDGSTTVTAEVPSAQQLTPGDPVRVDGVTVGQVQRISLSPRQPGGVVQMRVGAQAGPFYRNATAQVRFRTILGGAFAIALTRGTPGSGPLTGPIRLAQTSDQVETDDILDVTKGDARPGLQQLPRSLAQGLSDPSVLPRLLRTVAAASPSIRVGTSAARGLVPGYDLPEVITATARTTATLDRADAQLAGLIGNGATTFSAVASTSRALEASLAALPASLRFARSTLGGLDTTLSLVHPVLARLDVAAGPLAPTLIQVRGTASAADTLLRDAVPLLRQLRPASTALGQFARDGRPLIDKLEPGLTQLDDTILPMLGKKDPVTGKPLGTMIGGWGAALGSGAAGGEDANGHFIRFPATIGNANLYLPCQTYIDDFNHAQLLECESLQQTLSTLLGGAAGERRGGSG